MAPIVIGARATPLARIQARIVARHLGDLGVETTVRPMSTQGDRSLGGSFAQSRGVFTGELAAALRDGSVDLVVHSLKDLPVEDEPGLVIAAVPKRERPFDLLLLAPCAAARAPSTPSDHEPSAGGAEEADAKRAAATARAQPLSALLDVADPAAEASVTGGAQTPSALLDAGGAEAVAKDAGRAESRPRPVRIDAETSTGADAAANTDPVATPADAFAALPESARLGTSSPRRQAAALAIRPDLVCCAVRGSVGRRIEWLRSGAIDALLAAEAGLQRLAADGQLDEAAGDLPAFRLDLRSWPCAPGQGALGVQVLRGGRLDGHPAMAALDHAPSRAAALAERALLGRLGGGCLRPFGAWVEVGSAADAGAAAPLPGKPELRSAHALIAPDDWRQPAALGRAPAAVHVAAVATPDGPEGPGEIDLDDVVRTIEHRLSGAGAAARADESASSRAGGDSAGHAQVAIAGAEAPESDSTVAPSTARADSVDRTQAAIAAAANFGGADPGAPQPDLIVTSTPAAARRLTAGLEPALRVAALPTTKLEAFDIPWPVDAIDLDQPRRLWPWLLVSSPTAARVVAERAAREPAWGRLPWCALGEGTARALLAAGTPPNLAARANGGREFAAFAAQVLDPRCRLFLPHSARGGAPLIDALEAAGRAVKAWPAYTVNPRQDLAWPRGWQAARSIVLFTAPSAVAAFAGSNLPWPGTTWAIGTSTAAALESAGVGNVKCATQPTAAGVVRLWRDEAAGPRQRRPGEGGPMEVGNLNTRTAE